MAESGGPGFFVESCRCFSFGIAGQARSVQLVCAYFDEQFA